MKIIFVMFCLLTVTLSAQFGFVETSSRPGSFSRLGFGADGAGRGNAVSSDLSGTTQPLYNPALASYQEDNHFYTGYGLLSLDRFMNVLSFSRKFEFLGKPDSTGKRVVRSVAGISAGIINAGVSGIDKRDNQGIKNGDYSTSENLFFVSLSNKFSQKVTVGVTLRLYYYKLYEDIKSTGFGFDLGMIYRLNETNTFSLVIEDINSKYKWDTAPLYGTDGMSSTDHFPVRKVVGYTNTGLVENLTASLEYEFDNFGKKLWRGGAEYSLPYGFSVRTGLDQFVAGKENYPARYSAGFKYNYSVMSVRTQLYYTYLTDTFSPRSIHLLGLSLFI